MFREPCFNMRYILQNIYFVTRDLLKRIPRVFLSSFGIIFLIAGVVLFSSFRKAVRDYMEQRIFGKLSINEIMITPVQTSGSLNLTATAVSSHAIDNRKVRSIQSMKNLGEVYPVMRLNYPSILSVGMFGRYMKTDILISGVPREFFRLTKSNWRKFRDSPDIPVIIPYFALDLYNNFAVVNGLPEMSEKMLTGFTMDLIIGSSSFSESRTQFRYRTRVFGFTPRISSTGILVPLDFLHRFCRENSSSLGKSRPCNSCVMIIARVKDNRDIPSVVRKIKGMGLQVESQKDIADKTRKAVSFIDGAFLLVLIIVLALTVIAIFNSYLAMISSRMQEISLKRVIGESKFRIVIVFLLEALLAGLLYGLAGYYAGYLVINKLAYSLHQWIPLLKGLNLSMEFGPMLGWSMLLSSLVSIISAFIPALFASNLNLFSSSK